MAPNLSPGTHRALLPFSSALCSVRGQRATGAARAAKVPVLQVPLHNTVGLKVVLSTLKGTRSLGFRRTSLSML